MRRMMIAVAIVATTAAGCGLLPGEPVRSIEIRTDAVSYTGQDSVAVTINNGTREDAWFFHCNHHVSFTVEQQRGSGWEDLVGVDGPACPAIHEAGVMRLRPGESYDRRFAIDRAGTFRLRFLSSHNELNVGYDVLYSNTFTVE